MVLRILDVSSLKEVLPLKTLSYIIVGWLCVVVLGCSKPQEKVEPKTWVDVDDIGLEIPFASTDGVEKVVIDKKEMAEASKVMMTDFNLDGVKDMVVVTDLETEEKEKAEETGNAGEAPEKNKEITVYIGAENDPADSNITVQSYFKIASIRSSGDRKIVGVATGRRKGRVDLIILVRYGDQSTEMIHYRNKGDRFVRVEE